MHRLLPVLLAKFAHVNVVLLLGVGLATLYVKIAQAIPQVVEVSGDGAATQLLPFQSFDKSLHNVCIQQAVEAGGDLLLLFDVSEEHCENGKK